MKKVRHAFVNEDYGTVFQLLKDDPEAESDPKKKELLRLAKIHMGL
jgi:hypothetical protein